MSTFSGSSGGGSGGASDVISTYQMQAVQVRNKLIAASTASASDGWIPVKTSQSDLALARRINPSTAESSVSGKADMFIKMSPAALFEMLSSRERIADWMPHCNMQQVEDLNVGGAGIVHGLSVLEINYCTYQLYSPITVRDWCFLRFACVLSNGTYVMGCENTIHANCPERPGLVRGHIYPTGFVLRPSSLTDPNQGTIMSVIFSFDVKGWLPSVLRTLMQSDYFLAQTTGVFMNGIRRATIDIKEEQPADSPPQARAPESGSDEAFLDILRASDTHDPVGWHSVMNQDFEVHAKVVDNLSITRAIFKLDATPENFYQMVSDDACTYVTKMVPNVRSLEVLESSVREGVRLVGDLQFDRSCDKTIQITVKTDLGFDITFRLVHLVMFNTDDRTCMLISRSASAEEGASVLSSIMGKLMPSGFLVTPLPQDCAFVSACLQADLSTGFPAIMRALPNEHVCSLLTGGFVSIIHRLESLVNKSSVLSMSPDGFGILPKPEHNISAGQFDLNAFDYASFLVPSTASLVTSPTTILPTKLEDPPLPFSLLGKRPFINPTGPDLNPLNPIGHMVPEPSAVQQPKSKRAQTGGASTTTFDSMIPIPSKKNQPYPIIYNPATNQLMSPAHAVGMAQLPPAEEQLASINSSGKKSSTSRKCEKGRLIWTDELHDCFVKAVDKLGVQSARPQAILQLMNVEGLTAEHVKSHLQKYRAGLKTAKNGKLKRTDSQASISTNFSDTSSINTRPDAGGLAASVSLTALPLSAPSITLPHSTQPLPTQPAAAAAAPAPPADLMTSVGQIVNFSSSLSAKAEDFGSSLKDFAKMMNAFTATLQQTMQNSHPQAQPPPPHPLAIHSQPAAIFGAPRGGMHIPPSTTDLPSAAPR